MTSRERFLAAINHQQPDKVPVDISSGTASNMCAVTFNRLAKKLNFADRTCKIFDPIQLLAQLPMEAIEYFGVDVLYLGRDVYEDESYYYDFKLTDGTCAKMPVNVKTEEGEDGRTYMLSADGRRVAWRPNGGEFFDQLNFPYKASGYPADYKNLKNDLRQIMWNAIPRHPFQFGGESDFWDKMRKSAIELHEKGYATVVGAGGSFFDQGMFVRGMEDFFVDLYVDKAEVFRFFDALREVQLQGVKTVCDHLGDVVDVIRMGDDLGTANGSFIPSAVYREMIMPYHKAMNDYVHQHTKAKTVIHSCGSVYELVADIADAGFDLLNPVQISAAKMKPEDLKREFGDIIAFWGGGIDTSHYLPYATPDEVREHVLHNLEVFSPDGGFIFAPTHNILTEVPAENLIAMRNAIFEFNGK